MRWRPLALIAMMFVAAAAPASAQPLKKLQSHQAAKGTPLIEVVSWDCDWPGHSTVKVHGETKNISGFIQKDVKLYLVLRDRNNRALAQSVNKTLDVRVLPPNKTSTFSASMRMSDPAAVPAFCDLDLRDANGAFLNWRAAHPETAQTVEYIGTAKMLADGSIDLRLYTTTDGKDAHIFQALHKGDKLFDEVLSHVGGLKPGETKAVAPWPDDPKPGRGQ